MLFLNHIKLAFRQLWRQRMFTALNIVGLAVGLSACWIIWRISSYELSFDAGFPNGERVYRVTSRFLFGGEEGHNPGAPKNLGEAAAAAVSGLELSVPVCETGLRKFNVTTPNGKNTLYEDPKDLYTTNSNYFKLVDYQWLAGNSENALSQPYQIVLTHSRAEQYFPGMKPDEVVGQHITQNDTIQLTITGVVADRLKATHFDGKAFMSIPPRWLRPREWESVNSGNETIIRVLPGANLADIEKAINDLSYENGAKKMAEMGAKRWHVLQPMSDWHFNPDYEGSHRIAHRPTLRYLGLIALFLLLLACINFINLATAQAPARAREIGVRKTLGSSRGQLLGQFLLETGITSLLALALAYGLARLFFHFYKNFIPDKIPLTDNPLQAAIFLTILILVVSLLSGWYPGWFAARFEAVRALRGQRIVQVQGARITLRKSLIVFQFVVAQVFMIGAIIVGQQLQYGLKKDLGYDKEAVILLETPGKWWEHPDDLRRFSVKQELQRLSCVAGVGLGDPPACPSYSSNTLQYKDGKEVREFNVYRKYGDADIAPLYKMKLLAGRYLHTTDTVMELVVNEECVKRMGLSNPADAIGKVLEEEGKLTPIVGVVRDFHTNSLHAPIDPTALMCEKAELATFNIKLAATDPHEWQAALEQIKSVWLKTYPDAVFEPKFFDEQLLSFYEAEQRMSKIVNLATAVAILISCLGLFGLVTLTAFQRTKEIGVRKVLGAGITGIVALLAKDFLVLVAIACLIAAPISWYLMNKWLADFAYRISISGWVFLIAGLTAVLVAFLTVSYQSIKAALANPVDSLRSE